MMTYMKHSATQAMDYHRFIHDVVRAGCDYLVCKVSAETFTKNMQLGDDTKAACEMFLGMLIVYI